MPFSQNLLSVVTLSLFLAKILTVSSNIITELILLIGLVPRMARAALEESEEDSGEEDANSLAHDSGDDDYHTSDADEVSSSSSIHIFI